MIINPVLTVREKHYKLYLGNPIIVTAPGRINLIGEHTDYNDGFVLPAAIDKSITFAISRNKSDRFRFYSFDFDESFQTTDLNLKNAPQWVYYLIGVIAQFKKLDIDIAGIDCVFGGNIPIGAGLSSSAALECGFAAGINKLFNCKLTNYQLVKMAQTAEHEYAGVMCGIMDQFASVYGKKDHVFRLDCRSHDYNYFPLKMDKYVIALVNTKVEHELASSEYNLRRKECEAGVAILKNDRPNISSLRDVDHALLVSNRDNIDPTIYNRCSYVVSENQRVIDACEALDKSDFEEFGKLMYQSHEGLRKKYQVSCKELDILVKGTIDIECVLGSRMMGGGFGGCTINLIKRGFESDFENEISHIYKKETGIDPDFYFVNLSDGVSVMS